jgi:hypothetical protein
LAHFIYLSCYGKNKNIIISGNNLTNRILMHRGNSNPVWDFFTWNSLP